MPDLPQMPDLPDLPDLPSPTGVYDMSLPDLPSPTSMSCLQHDMDDMDALHEVYLSNEQSPTTVEDNHAMTTMICNQSISDPLNDLQRATCATGDGQTGLAQTPDGKKLPGKKKAPSKKATTVKKRTANKTAAKKPTTSLAPVPHCRKQKKSKSERCRQVVTSSFRNPGSPLIVFAPPKLGDDVRAKTMSFDRFCSKWRSLNTSKLRLTLGSRK